MKNTTITSTSMNDALTSTKSVKRTTIFNLLDKGIDDETIADFAGIKVQSLGYYKLLHKKMKNGIPVNEKIRAYVDKNKFTKSKEVFDETIINNKQFIVIDGKKNVITKCTEQKVEYVTASNNEIVMHSIGIDEVLSSAKNVMFV